MDFMACYSKTPVILMEGALGERLKREYGICFDETLGLAGLAEDVLKLRDYIQLKIVGGCCGTDGSHIRAIAGKICAAGESRQR